MYEKLHSSIRWSFALALLWPAAALAGPTPFEPNLRKVADGQGGRVVNRKVSQAVDGARTVLHLGDGRGEGIVWFDGSEFANGVIEVDLKGRDLMQRSFVGVAFHGAGDRSYEAVYFRPFNFHSPDAERRSHAVQYIAAPAYPWQRLRRERTGEYEKPIPAAPKPDGWFHVRVVVASPKVSVFVEDAKEPCLVVEQLNKKNAGRLGLWVGDGSDGSFANFKAVAAPANQPGG